MASRIGGIPALVKGYIDATISVLVAVRADIVQSFNSTQRQNLIANLGQINPFQTIQMGSTVTIPMAASCNSILTLTGNATIAAPTNALPGVTYLLYLRQDGIGNRTVSWASGVFDFGGAGAPAISVTPNKTDIVALVCDSASPMFRCSVIGRGFSV